MLPEFAQAPPPPAAETISGPGSRTHGEAISAFWQVITHFDATKLSTHRAFRNAVGVVLPLTAGFALGMPRGGLVVASGALNVSYSDGSDPYSERARRMLASSVICAIAVFAGAISGQHQVAAIVLATIWAFIAGMANALGGAAPDLGVISLVTLLIYAAQPLTPRQAAASVVLALAGGLLQTALSVALWSVRRYDPERRALANLFLELANRAAAPLIATSAPLASIHSEEAQQALLGLTRDPGPESMRYRALLSQAERIRLSLLMLSRLRARMERERHDYPAIENLTAYLELASKILREIGSLLLASPHTRSEEIKLDLLHALDQQISNLREQNAETPVSFLAAVAKDGLFQMDALAGQLRAALDLAGNNVSVENFGAPQPLVRRIWHEGITGRLAMLRENLNLQSATFRHALRLAVLVALGDIGRSVSWRRTYWLPMTIVLVLKPEFTATFTRGVLRIIGTIIGLLLATALFHVIHPVVALQVALIFLFVFFLRWLGPANYGIFAIVVSGLIVLLLAIAGVPPKDVISARGINTVVGGTMAILAYRLWPTWERTRISERIARMLDAYRDYLHAVLRFDPAAAPSIQELERSRRAARVARSNLEASVDRLSSEPGATREQLSRLNAILVSSHRFIHAVMALDAIVLDSPAISAAAPLKKFAAAAETTLALLSSALRGGRVMSRALPDLREEHRLMVQARTAGAGESVSRYDSISVEADRITNSMNTMTEQIMQWMRSPEFAELRSMYLRATPGEHPPAS